jgi:rhamnulokinase
MSDASFLAIDLGAESGRAMLGSLQGGRLGLEEVHRFPNGPVRVADHLYWDVLRLWSEIQNGLRMAGARSQGRLACLGVDTWGVDFGLLDAADSLVGNPYHYRDSHTDGVMDAAFQVVPREEIYRQTGIQFMQFNSLFQLLAMRRANAPALDYAQTFLNMPDLFNFWLTGRKASEFTIATTSQCYHPLRGEWAWDLLEKLALPAHIFQPLVQPGEILGELRARVAQEVGLPRLPVTAIGSHDTASAVAAVPASSHRYAFISSGTWSLVGSVIDAPLISPASLEFNFTNEGGIGGTYRFLKNISGLWLVQECRRAWAAEGQSYSYAELTALAESAPPFLALVDPNDAGFLSPGDMPGRIRRYCQQSGQPAPETVGSMVRCALESLALAYRQTIQQVEQVLGYRLEAIHIVGGGSQNRLLNQFAADATGLPVVAGPVEATAIGNLLVQGMALGHLASLEEARQVVRNSFPVEIFEPGKRDAWDQAYLRWSGNR